MIPREQKSESFLYGAPFCAHLTPADMAKIEIYKRNLAGRKVILDCDYWKSVLESCKGCGIQVQTAINILEQVASSLQSRDTPLRGGL